MKAVFALLSLVFINSCLLTACYKDEPQNFDTLVSGQANNINAGGIGGVTIYIDTGRGGNFFGPKYGRYDSTITNFEGKYSYLIKGKEAGYSYQVCCKAPSGYTMLSESCRSIDVVGGGASNVIDFSFIR